MFLRYFFGTLMLGSLTLLTATAEIVAPPNLDKLTESSDLIVLGELVVVERGIGRTDGNPASARDRGTLRVDHVLRGMPQSLLVLESTVAEQNAGMRIPPQQEYGLFFFRIGEKGRVLFTDPNYSYIPVPRGLSIRGTTALDRVVSVLGDMLLLPRNVVKTSPIFYLQSSKSKAANTALRAALDSPDSELSIRVVNGLILQGDASSLRVIKRAFLTGPRIAIDRFQEEAIGNAMSFYLKDPDAIPDLEALLASPSVYIRRGAVGALSRMQSPRSVNGLVRSLEDTDSEVRYWGVVGLAEVTGQNNWRPNEALFKSEENKFLTYWKEWARNRREKR